MKIEMADGGRSIDITPSSEDERRVIDFLVERNCTHSLQFVVHGKSQKFAKTFSDAVTKKDGFIRVTVGEPFPEEARR